MEAGNMKTFRLISHSPDETGVTVLEYVCLAGAILLVSIGVIAGVGNNSNNTFSTIESSTNSNQNDNVNQDDENEEDTGAGGGWVRFRNK